jgi:hypothetical protein
LVALSAIAGLALQSGRAVAAGHDFTICHGRFALCAASTCKATGKNITVNVTGGGTATFPEYNCTCPILDGPSDGSDLVALLTTGTHPAGDQELVPSTVESSAPPQVCKADLNLGDKLINCFSFACNPAGSIRGVPVATCHCPLGESLEGKPVQPATPFVTQAGQGNTALCSEYPVGGPLPSISPP